MLHKIIFHSFPFYMPSCAQLGCELAAHTQGLAPITITRSLTATIPKQRGRSGDSWDNLLLQQQRQRQCKRRAHEARAKHLLQASDSWRWLKLLMAHEMFMQGDVHRACHVSAHLRRLLDCSGPPVCSSDDGIMTPCTSCLAAPFEFVPMATRIH